MSTLSLMVTLAKRSNKQRYLNDGALKKRYDSYSKLPGPSFIIYLYDWKYENTITQ